MHSGKQLERAEIMQLYNINITVNYKNKAVMSCLLQMYPLIRLEYGRVLVKDTWGIKSETSASKDVFLSTGALGKPQ